MTRLRWWLWARLDLLAYLVCPDKKTLNAIRRVGLTRAKEIVQEGGQT